MTNKQYIKQVVQVLKENKITVLTVILLAIISDIIFFQQRSDFIIFGILGVYAIAIWMYGLKSRLAFQFCLLLLSIMFIEFIFAGTSLQTEKAAVWLFLFIAIGIIQQIRE